MVLSAQFLGAVNSPATQGRCCNSMSGLVSCWRRQSLIRDANVMVCEVFSCLPLRVGRGDLSYRWPLRIVSLHGLRFPPTPYGGGVAAVQAFDDGNQKHLGLLDEKRSHISGDNKSAKSNRLSLRSSMINLGRREYLARRIVRKTDWNLKAALRCVNPAGSVQGTAQCIKRIAGETSLLHK
jgi:hypothetical protein